MILISISSSVLQVTSVHDWPHHQFGSAGLTQWPTHRTSPTPRQEETSPIEPHPSPGQKKPHPSNLTHHQARRNLTHRTSPIPRPEEILGLSSQMSNECLIPISFSYIMSLRPIIISSREDDSPSQSMPNQMFLPQVRKSSSLLFRR